MFLNAKYAKFFVFFDKCLTHPHMTRHVTYLFLLSVALPIHDKQKQAIAYINVLLSKYIFFCRN
jgi:hypothetical protein